NFSGLGTDAEQRFADPFHRLDHFTEMESRAERLDLLHQLGDQALSGNERYRGNVVDRLLRIKLCALPTRLVENVDEMRLHVEKAKLEHGEQSDRARSDNNDVGFDRIAHALDLSVPAYALG